MASYGDREAMAKTSILPNPVRPPLQARRLIVPATDENIELAAQFLREGRLVAFPTETVYGLGANALERDAVRRIFAAKRRPIEHPLIVHIENEEVLPRWTREIPVAARVLARAFWPGPLTLVLARAHGVPDEVTGGQDSVGVRVPAHPVARSLLHRFAARGGAGIAAPSANRFGRISATRADHVDDEFGDEISLILDAGPTAHGIESTIVDLTADAPRLLRPGAITVEQLEAVLERRLSAANDASPRASGTLASHYAPRTAARLLSRERLLSELAGARKSRLRIAVLAYSIEPPPGFDGVWLSAPDEAAAYARRLYASLRTLDAAAADEMWIEAPPDGPAWFAIHDRLRRATYHGD